MWLLSPLLHHPHSLCFAPLLLAHYAIWRRSGYFNPSVLKSSGSQVIVWPFLDGSDGSGSEKLGMPLVRWENGQYFIILSSLHSFIQTNIYWASVSQTLCCLVGTPWLKETDLFFAHNASGLWDSSKWPLWQSRVQRAREQWKLTQEGPLNWTREDSEKARESFLEDE